MPRSCFTSRTASSRSSGTTARQKESAESATLTVTKKTGELNFQGGGVRTNGPVPP